jgi:hypothetical protein
VTKNAIKNNRGGGEDGNKNKNKTKYQRISNCFFWGAAANVRHFRHFFFTAPLAPASGAGAKGHPKENKTPSRHNFT